MPWQPVYGSSNVSAIQYNEATRECSVKFLGGDDTYVYLDVSPEEWNSFVHSESKGKYVWFLKRNHAFRKE
jgi:hypothetical protein